MACLDHDAHVLLLVRCQSSTLLAAQVLLLVDARVQPDLVTVSSPKHVTADSVS